jgi:hypothetical protein
MPGTKLFLSLHRNHTREKTFWREWGIHIGPVSN